MVGLLYIYILSPPSHGSEPYTFISYIAIFAANTLTTKTVDKHLSNTLSAVWIVTQNPDLYPIIIGSVYHPPDANAQTTLDYIETTLNKLLKKYQNAKLILAGDFNRLPLDGVKGIYQLRTMVNFNTRGSACLDLILTDIPEYGNAIKLAPIANNDHCSILLKGVQVSRKKYVYINRRQYNYSVRQDILHDLACTDWSEILNMTDVNGKFQLYTVY